MSLDFTFEQFYRNHFSAVRIFILSKCMDNALAQDIAQESFLRLYQNFSKIDSDKRRSYVYTVANNLFLDFLRHNKVKNAHASFVSNYEKPLDPHKLHELEEFKEKIQRVLGQMPEHAREVFLLNRMEKMTYTQIAHQLQVSVKTIEKRMQKALEYYAELRRE